jgi:shikimate dehydrogenase
VSGAQTAELETRTVPTMEFVGVTTTRSSIMRVFPRWTKTLGLGEARLVGRDLPLGADPQLYRLAVEQIRDDPLSVGALVTAHKIKLLDAARDLFDELDPYAELTSEVSCISKHDGAVVGHAKDPITAGRSLGTVLGSGYFARTGGEVMCVGAGGSGTAISVHLMTRTDPADRPARILMVGRDRESLDDLRAVHERIETPTTEVEYVENEDPARNDALMGALPDASVIVNATGMGKDLPGSPITDDATFPRDGVAWELNYRGELDFLHQARRQQSGRNLTVEDGWLYFLHGWSEVIAEVFHLHLTDRSFRALRSDAEAARP